MTGLLIRSRASRKQGLHPKPQNMACNLHQEHLGVSKLTGKPEGDTVMHGLLQVVWNGYLAMNPAKQIVLAIPTPKLALLALTNPW